MKKTPIYKKVLRTMLTCYALFAVTVGSTLCLKSCTTLPEAKPRPTFPNVLDTMPQLADHSDGIDLLQNLVALEVSQQAKQFVK